MSPPRLTAGSKPAKPGRCTCTKLINRGAPNECNHTSPMDASSRQYEFRHCETGALHARDVRKESSKLVRCTLAMFEKKAMRVRDVATKPRQNSCPEKFEMTASVHVEAA